jgi:hypothetical protein
MVTAMFHSNDPAAHTMSIFAVPELPDTIHASLREAGRFDAVPEERV